MIKILRKLFEVMIEVGNTIITTLSIGSSTLVKIDWGNDKVWPEGTGDYIILPRTGATIASASNYSYISNISASTTAWTVTSSDSSWLTAYRVSGIQARFNVTENTSVDYRTATLSFKIGTAEYATYTVRQMGTAVFIVLTPRLVQLSDGTSRTSTISVSANTTAWTVTTTSTWITAEKFVPYSTPMVRYTLEENSGTTQRTGYITVSYGATNAQTQVNQGYGIYVLTGLTTNPVSLSSGQTNFAISIVSKLGNTATTEPSVSIGYNPQLNVQLISMQTGGTTGQHNYFFSCNTASTTGQTTASIVFTQPNSNKTLTYVVNQKGKANPSPTGTTISGFTVSKSHGDWELGKYITSYANIGGANTPIYAMAILNPNNVSGEYTYDIDADYYTRTTTQSDSTIDRTQLFTAHVINIPSGGTAYGVTITGGPNLTITTVRTFKVT